MVEEKVGAVAVLEHGVLVGLLTERDLMRRVMDPELDNDAITAADVMTTSLPKIAPEAKRGTALKLMLTGHRRHLPVTDATGKVLGMLSIRHLLRERLRSLQGQVESLVSYMAADGPGG